MNDTPRDKKPKKEAPKKDPLLLKLIKPKTVNQNKIFKQFNNNHLLIHGTAGTGKSFVATYLALDAILNKQTFNKLIIVRSAVPSRSQGFLPGSEEEKNEIFELPYIAIVNELFDNPGAYKYFKNMGIIQFVSTSYLRGLTINDAVVIVDEVQNLNPGEASTIITRMGSNIKLILCGDTDQDDLQYLRQDSCMSDLIRIIDLMDSFYIIEMEIADIVRNGVVKEFIIARSKVANNLPNFVRDRK